MIEGDLVYDPNLKRLDIVRNDGASYGGFHCGNVIEIKTESGDWIPARIEYASDEWFLDGLYKPGEIPYGLKARFGW